MKQLVEKVEKEVMEKIKWHKETTINRYDFWNEIKKNIVKNGYLLESFWIK